MKNLLIASLLLLTSCASGPVYSGIADNQQTKVVIYRGANLFNTWGTYWIEMNNQQICDLHDSAFVVRIVNPGQVNISSSKFGTLGTSKVNFSIKKGETVYIKMEVNGNKMFSGIFGGLIGSATNEAIDENAGPVYLGTVSKDKAHTEMQGLNQDCQ